MSACYHSCMVVPPSTSHNYKTINSKKPRIKTLAASNTIQTNGQHVATGCIMCYIGLRPKIPINTILAHAVIVQLLWE